MKQGYILEEDKYVGVKVLGMKMENGIIKYLVEHISPSGLMSGEREVVEKTNLFIEE